MGFSSCAYFPKSNSLISVMRRDKTSNAESKSGGRDEGKIIDEGKKEMGRRA